MKQKIALALLLAFSCNTTMPVKSSIPLLGKLYNLLKFPLAPSEVTHTFEIARIGDQPYRLDIQRIEELQKMYEHNFKLRERLALTTYALTAGSLLWVGYKWGMFDWLLPSKTGEPVSTEQINPPNAAHLNSQVDLIAYCKENTIVLSSFAATMTKFQEALETKKDAKSGYWIIDGIKYVGWAGVSIAGSLIVQSKWYSFFGYALAEPSFKWFLSNHSIISTIDRLKRSVHALSSPTLSQEFADYHANSLVPAVEAIMRNMEQLIAFTDFYLPQIDEELVKKEGLCDVPRFLYNLTNDFLAQINPLLNNPSGKAALVPVIDEYRADIVSCINRCKNFEDEL